MEEKVYSVLNFPQKIRYSMIGIFEKCNVHISKSYPRAYDEFLKNHFGLKSLVGVEIGIFRGEHTKFLLDFLNIKKFYLIDPYVSYEDHGDIEMLKAREKAKKILYNHKDKIEYLYLFSEDGAVEVNEKVDFCYIDGDHSYEGVKTDIKVWYPLIKKGGVIGGHDFFSYDAGKFSKPADYNGVVKAVMEFVKDNNYKLWVGKKGEWWIVKGEEDGSR